MSSFRSHAPGIILTTLVLAIVLGGCGESPVYTRSALDGGAASERPPLGQWGGSPAGTGGAGGDATRGNGGGRCNGIGGARWSNGCLVVVLGGQSGTAAAGQGGNQAVVGPGGRDGVTPGSGTQGPGGSGGSGGGGATGSGPAGTGGSNSSGGIDGGVTCGGIEPVSPRDGVVSDFASITTSGGSWTASNGVTGRTFAYHGGMPSTVNVELGAIAHDLHCTASLGDTSYAGCGVVVDGCLAAGANAALRFSISGRSNCDVALQIQTYDRKPTTDTPAGGCRGMCGKYSSSASLTLRPGPITVALSTLTNWTSASAAQVVGVEWKMTPPAGKTSCTTDLRFDDIVFVP